MSLQIKGRVILITGANRGIGKALLEESISRGAAKVYAAVRDLKTAKPLVQQHGEKVVPLHIDLLDRDSVRKAAETASDAEIVINNAGVLKTASPLSPTAIEALQFEMQVNVYGLIEVAQAFAPVLARNGGGALVQLNSVASLRNFADFATYSASKAASYSITQGLRDKLAEQNTQVFSVHPGPIQTEMAKSAGLDEMAEPPSLVSIATCDAIEQGRFHVWPDTMAKQFGEAYQSFAQAVVEADPTESPA